MPSLQSASAQTQNAMAKATGSGLNIWHAESATTGYLLHTTSPNHIIELLKRCFFVIERLQVGNYHGCCIVSLKVVLMQLLYISRGHAMEIQLDIARDRGLFQKMVPFSETTCSVLVEDICRRFWEICHRLWRNLSPTLGKLQKSVTDFGEICHRFLRKSDETLTSI